MPRLVWLMTTALGFTAAAAYGSDGTAAKISQIDHPGQNGGPVLFERTQSVRQVAPPYLTYHYVRTQATKKDTAHSTTFMSHTHNSLYLTRHDW